MLGSLYSPCNTKEDRYMKAVPALCITLDGLEGSLFKFCNPKYFELVTKLPPHSSKVYLVWEMGN